ncbi:sulfatase-like hydrolase/transferase [Botrimarina colliarenosi]
MAAARAGAVRFVPRVRLAAAAWPCRALLVAGPSPEPILPDPSRRSRPIPQLPKATPCCYHIFRHAKLADSSVRASKYAGRYKEGWDSLREERFRRQEELGVFDAETPLGPLPAKRPVWDSLSASDQDFEASKMAVHAAMVDRVDQGLGKVVDQLRKNGQLDNTVLVFISDNGASPEIPGGPGYDRNSGTRDGQTALRDHDLREPENRSKLGSDGHPPRSLR